MFRGKERRFRIYSLSPENLVEWMNWCNAQPNRHWLVPQFDGVTESSEILDVEWQQDRLTFGVLIFDPSFDVVSDNSQVPNQPSWGDGPVLHRIDFPNRFDFQPDVDLPFQDTDAVVLTREA